MKTKKIKNINRKTLKGGFFWRSKTDKFHDIIIKHLFLSMSPLRMITSHDKKNMIKFKKIITELFANDYFDYSNGLRLYLDDGDIIELLKKHNYISFPQIEDMTRSENHKVEQDYIKSSTKRILKHYGSENVVFGGFFWRKNIYDELFKDNKLRKRYHIAYEILKILCYTELDLINNIQFLKNIKHFEEIMSSEFVDDYEILKKSRKNIIKLLHNYGYNVHYTIERNPYHSGEINPIHNRQDEF
jgi:hypothetical protein